MPARKRSVRAGESVEEVLDRVLLRIDELETMLRSNRRSLDLQFRRMADMQVEIDRLIGDSKKPETIALVDGRPSNSDE